MLKLPIQRFQPNPRLASLDLPGLGLRIATHFFIRFDTHNESTLIQSNMCIERSHPGPGVKRETFARRYGRAGPHMKDGVGKWSLAYD